MVQIRKGVCGKTAQQLVRIPQVDARSKFYVEAAKTIGEREALALPYHGSRMWKCEIKVCILYLVVLVHIMCISCVVYKTQTHKPNPIIHLQTYRYQMMTVRMVTIVKVEAVKRRTVQRMMMMNSQRRRRLTTSHQHHYSVGIAVH